MDIKLCIVCFAFLFGYTQAACEDSLTPDSPFIIGKKKIGNCPELFEKFPGSCEDNKVGGKKGRCCKTCGDPKCLDKLTKFAPPFTVDGKKFTSCKDVVDKHPVLCKTQGKKKKSCCRSCKGVNTKCVDDLVTFTDKKLVCSDYIAEDNCHCFDKKTKKQCCASCKDIDTSGCACRDLLSKKFKQPIKITNHDNGKNLVDKNVDNCEEIVNYYVQLCKDIGKKGKPCCKSCSGKNHKCGDNLAWIVNAEKGNLKCRNCNCHQVMKKSQALMAHICNENTRGVRSALRTKEACCLQCSRV